MKGYATMLVRFTIVALFGMVGLAVIVGRAIPETPRYRLLDETRPTLIGHSVYRSVGPESFYINRGDNSIGQFRLPDTDTLQLASLSPWKDESGEWQAVGFWSRRTGTKDNWTMSTSALARISFPSGRLINRIETDVLPSSKPTWSPGTEARVIFAGSNGGLYSVSFDRDGENSLSNKDRDPVRLSWMVEGIHAENLVLSEPSWPTDIRMGGKLLVSMVSIGRFQGKTLDSQGIWWLQLDPSGTAIVDAGRITPPTAQSNEMIEMSPVVESTPEGQLLLSYVTRSLGEAIFKLNVVPIEFDPESGNPVVAANEGRTICQELRPEGPTFSSDMRWVNFVIPSQEDVPLVHRMAVSDFITPGKNVPSIIAGLSRPRSELVARLKKSEAQVTNPSPRPAQLGPAS